MIKYCVIAFNSREDLLPMIFGQGYDVTDLPELNNVYEKEMLKHNFVALVCMELITNKVVKVYRKCKYCGCIVKGD